MKEILVCSDCGSENIQTPFWVNPNTFEVFEEYDLDDAYCEDCKFKVSITLQENYDY